MPSSASLTPVRAEKTTASVIDCRSWTKDLLILAVVTGLWFCALLGMRPLSNPDEGRYTEIPREMAVTGDFVTPRLNGVKYFEKPPLVYWLSALTIREFGASEFTGRLWGGIFSVIGVLLTYAAGRVIYGRSAGIWAAIILATNLMYYIMSQIILLDMAVAVTMSGCLFAFILAMRQPPGRKRFGLFMAFYAFMALATLSKGLIGIALPGAVIFLWVLTLNRWRQLWPIYPLCGTVLLLAIAAPWHIYAARANPDFLNFYFYHEHWLRFTTKIHGRYEPWWFFLPIFVGGLFPWVFLAVPALRKSLAGGWKARQVNSEAWFFVIWTVFVILFFSKSQSKLVPYILPVFPAVAVMIGSYVASVWDGSPGGNFRRGIWGFVVISGMLALALRIAPELKFVIKELQGQPEIAAYLPILRLTLSGSLTLGSVAAYIGLRRNQPRLMLGAVAISTALFLVATAFAGGSFDKASTKKFAMILKPMLKTEDRVYSVGIYTQDLPVYLNRLISVVEYTGELGYGIKAEPELTSQRFMDRTKFATDWAKPGLAYAVIRGSSYEKWFSSSGIPHKVLAQTARFVLVVKTENPAALSP
jgi:4-amino-4-deoxy-L-arabinose transferase-like glycosyltransferase